MIKLVKVIFRVLCFLGLAWTIYGMIEGDKFIATIGSMLMGSGATLGWIDD